MPLFWAFYQKTVVNTKFQIEASTGENTSLRSEIMEDDNMANKNLKYFMRQEAKEEIIVDVEGLESIKDENGQVVPFKIKKLHNETVDKINKMYVTRVPAKDKKGNFIIQNGEIVYRVEKDKTKAFLHILVEALVYPDLKDNELMEFFGCHDITEMPRRVFPTNDEYTAVAKKVMEVLGLVDPDEADQKEVDDAKNS